MGAPTNMTPELSAADQEAVEGTNDGSLTWQEAHERWTHRTKRDLSPAGFGKRILSLGGGNRAKQPTKPTMPPPPVSLPHAPSTDSSVSSTVKPSPPLDIRKHPSASSFKQSPQQEHVKPPSASPPSTNHSFRPTNGVAQHSPPLLHPQPSSSPAAAPKPIQPTSQPRHYIYPGEPQQPLPAPAAVRQGLPDNMERQRADIDRIGFALSELQQAFQQVSHSLAALTHEFQSFRASGPPRAGDTSTLEVLSETVSKASDKAGEIDGVRIQVEVLKSKVKQLEEGAHIASSPNAQTPQGHFSRAPSHQHPPQQSPGLPGTNDMKRRFSEDQPIPMKRQRPDTREFIVYGEIPPPQPGPLQYAPIPSSYQPVYHEDPQHSADLPLRRHGPGRPRKYDSPIAPNSQLPHMEHDPTHNTLNTSPTATAMPISPSMRGRVIRRNSGGGAPGPTQPGELQLAPVDVGQQMGPGKEKQTRQRPIRNADGILIRKDGKPDLRSISSPQNLRKVHAKRLAEAHGSGRADGRSESPGGSPLTRSVSADGDSHSHKGGSPPESKNSGKNNHSEVMRQMFPHGVDEDSRRMDHAASLFSLDDRTRSREPKELPKLQPREEMAKDEAGTQARRTDGENKENDATQVPQSKWQAVNAKPAPAHEPAPEPMQLDGAAETEHETHAATQQASPPAKPQEPTTTTATKPTPASEDGDEDAPLTKRTPVATPNKPIAARPLTRSGLSSPSKTPAPPSSAERARTRADEKLAAMKKSAWVEAESQQTYRPSQDIDSLAG